MTTSVADKTPISAKVWRRHTDPPSLWIVVGISSVSLHLLAFWFMRSSNIFRPWFPQQSQGVVPIEFVEISSQAKPKLTVKKVTPKPSKASQQSVPSRLPKKTQTTPNNQTSDVINSEDTTLNSSKTKVSQANTPLFPQKIVSTPTPKPTPTSKPEPTPTIPPVGDLPWNRRQEIKLGRGKPLPTGIPSVPSEQTRRSETEQEQIPGIPGEETASTPTRESSRIPGEETASTPTRESSRIPGEETTSTPTRESSRIPGEETTPTPTPTRESSRIPGEETTPTSTPTRETPRVPKQGGSIAIATPLSRNEVLQLTQEGRLRYKELPDVLAKYQGSNTKTLDSSFLPGDSGLQPAQLLTSLTIDENGKFKQAVVIEIEPVKLQSEKVLYEKVINELFNNENFLPGHNQDGTKPELSYLFVKVTIKPVNSN